MLIVTGGAGFIGANLLQGLNARGVDDIVVVDNLANAAKVGNLADCRIADYLDKREFRARLARPGAFGTVEAVFHQGACSDTMATDGRYVMDNNYTYSCELLQYCQAHTIPLIYASSASVYGAGDAFREDPVNEAPLNVYAYSKLLFDHYVRRIDSRLTAPVVGLRYFNVYGSRERHKGRMASVAMHFADQYRRDGVVRLFAASGGYADGDQRRDFVSVADVVAVNLYFLDHPEVAGVFNVGTGASRSFNAMAAAVINACRNVSGDATAALDDLVGSATIQYAAMPDALKDKYQSYTEADIGALRQAGYRAAFHSLEQGVADYLGWLARSDA